MKQTEDDLFAWKLEKGKRYSFPAEVIKTRTLENFKNCKNSFSLTLKCKTKSGECFIECINTNSHIKESMFTEEDTIWDFFDIMLILDENPHFLIDTDSKVKRHGIRFLPSGYDNLLEFLPDNLVKIVSCEPITIRGQLESRKVEIIEDFSSATKEMKVTFIMSPSSSNIQSFFSPVTSVTYRTILISGKNFHIFDQVNINGLYFCTSSKYCVHSTHLSINLDECEFGNNYFLETKATQPNQTKSTTQKPFVFNFGSIPKPTDGRGFGSTTGPTAGRGFGSTTGPTAGFGGGGGTGPTAGFNFGSTTGFNFGSTTGRGFGSTTGPTAGPTAGGGGGGGTGAFSSKSSYESKTGSTL